MHSKRLALSVILITFLIPLNDLSLPDVQGITVPNLQTCPQSSTQSICDFNYPDFTSTNGLILNGNAFQYGGSILRLTPSIQSQAGSAWYYTKQNVSEDFTSVFHFQITPSGGADGFAFVIQNNGTSSLGSKGWGLGYDGIPSSIAIEFDTYQNGAHLFDTNLGDISDHEIAVHTNGLSPNSAYESHALPPGPIISPIEFQSDLQPHAVKVVYTLGVLEVFLDDFSNPVLAVSVNLKSTLGLSDGTAFVGFTASTGAQTENHDILDWFLVTQAPNSNIIQNGDFSNNLLGWKAVRSSIVSGTRGEYPIFQAVTAMPAPSRCTPVGRRGTPFLTIDSAFNASGYVEQQVTIPSLNAHLTFVSWGWESANRPLAMSGLTNATVVVVDSSGTHHVLDLFSPPPMLNVIDPTNPASDTCTGNTPLSKSYDFSPFAGQTVKLRLGSQSNNCCGTLTAFADVDIEAPGIAVFQCPAFAGFKATPGSCALPNASPGRFYSYKLPVTGGVPPYDFTLASGTLPSGLILETNGNIQGTTTSNGVFPFNLTIQDQGPTPPITVSFTIAVPPIVTGLSPSAGPVTGGTKLNITGEGFSQATSVSFNSTTSGYHTISDTLIHVDSTPASQTGCGIFCTKDAPGIDNVNVAINNYHSSSWCLSPNPVSQDALYVLHSGCGQFTYLRRDDVQFCSSSTPDGLVALPSLQDNNLRFKASYDASAAVADAELSGSIAVTPRAGYCLHLSGGRLTSFNFTTVFDYSASISASLSLTTQYDNLNKPFILAGPFQSSPLVAGPVIIVPTVTPVLMISASANAKISGAFSYNSETTYRLGFSTDASKWAVTTDAVTCVMNPTTGRTATLDTLCFQPTSTAMTVNGKVKLAMGLQFSLLLYDVAGPVITPDLYLRLDAGSSTGPQTNGPSCDGLQEGTKPGSWGALCAGLELGVGVQLNPLLDFLLPSTNWPLASFDVKSILLAATISANPGPNAMLQADGTFKLNPSESTSVTTTVAGSDLPTSLAFSSSWNPSWIAPTCGTLGQTAPGVFQFTEPYSGGVCVVKFTKNFLGLNVLTSATLSFRIGYPPSAPQGTRANPESGDIVVQWESPSSDGGAAVTAYNVYRGTASGSESLVQTLGSALSYSDGSGVCGSTYFYRISATNIVGESPQSSEVQAVVICVASVPERLATTESSNGITLSWQPPTSDGGSTITGYIVYRSEFPGQESFLARVGAVSSYTDTSVVAGKTYYYKVAAINGAGTSTPSSEARSTTSSNTPPAPPPTTFPWTIFYAVVGGATAVIGLITGSILLRRRRRSPN